MDQDLGQDSENDDEVERASVSELDRRVDDPKAYLDQSIQQVQDSPNNSEVSQKAAFNAAFLLLKTGKITGGKRGDKPTHVDAARSIQNVNDFIKTALDTIPASQPLTAVKQNKIISNLTTVTAGPARTQYKICFTKNDTKIQGSQWLSKKILDAYGISNEGNRIHAVTSQDPVFQNSVKYSISKYNKTNAVQADLITINSLSQSDKSALINSCGSLTQHKGDNYRGALNGKYLEELLNESNEDSSIIRFKSNTDVIGMVVLKPFSPDLYNTFRNALSGSVVNQKKDFTAYWKGSIKGVSVPVIQTDNEGIDENTQTLLVDQITRQNLEFKDSVNAPDYNRVLQSPHSSIMEIVVSCSLPEKKARVYTLIADIAKYASIGAIILEPANSSAPQVLQNVGALVCTYLKYGFSPIKIQVLFPNTRVLAPLNVAVDYMIITPFALQATMKYMEKVGRGLQGGFARQRQRQRQHSQPRRALAGGVVDTTAASFDITDEMVEVTIRTFNATQVDNTCKLIVSSVGKRSDVAVTPPELLEAARILHTHVAPDFVAHVWQNISGYKRRGEMRGFLFHKQQVDTGAAGSNLVGMAIIAPFEPHFASDANKRAQLNRMSTPQLVSLLGSEPVNVSELQQGSLKESLINLAIKKVDDSAFATMNQMFRVLDNPFFNDAMDKPADAVRLLDLVLIISPGHGDDVMNFVDMLIVSTHAEGVIVEPPPGNKAVTEVFRTMHNFALLGGGHIRKTTLNGVTSPWIADPRSLLFKARSRL